VRKEPMALSAAGWLLLGGIIGYILCHLVVFN
jgi:hypothetical protein